MSSCGIQNWGMPKPGDPNNNGVLQATAAYGGIELSWSYPTLNPFAVAYVKVYRSINSLFSNALQIALVNADRFYDPQDPGAQFWYWIRFVSVNGTENDLIGPATAIANDHIENLIEQLTGRIDAGVLAIALRAEIDKIPAIEFNVQQEIIDRIAENATLSTFLAALDTDVTQVLTLVQEEITQRTDGDATIIESVNALGVGQGDNAALITEERNLRIAADEALAEDINLVYAQVGTDISAAVQTTTTAYTNADNALASYVAATYATNNGVTAAIQSESSARTNAISAETIARNTQYAQVGPAITAAIQTESIARTDAISAETTSRNTQFASVAPAISTAVADEATARDSAIGTAIANETALRNTAITAAVQTETTARVNADSALAQQITTAETNLGGDIAQVQTTLQTNIDAVDGEVNQIGALYTVKVNVNGLAGGFGIYNDGSTIQAGFDLDEFWVGKTQANKRKPFIIVDGVTYIDDAAINKLTFNKLRDESGSFIVENGKVKVAYLDADNIIAKKINVETITGLGGVFITDKGIAVKDATGVLRGFFGDDT